MPKFLQSYVLACLFAAIQAVLPISLSGQEAPKILSIEQRGDTLVIQSNHRSSSLRLEINDEVVLDVNPDEAGNIYRNLDELSLRQDSNFFILYIVKDNKPNEPFVWTDRPPVTPTAAPFDTKEDSSAASDTMPTPPAKPQIVLSELTYSGTDRVHLSVGETLPQDTAGNRLIEYVQKVTDAASRLKKEGYILTQLEIKAYLNSKSLSKALLKEVLYTDPIEVKYKLKGKEEIETLAEADGEIATEWQLALLKLATLKHEIAKLGILSEDQIQISILSPEKNMPQALHFDYMAQASAPLLQSKMDCARTLHDLKQPTWLDSLFNQVDFDDLEQVKAAYHSTEKKLVISYTNYETAYQIEAGLEKLTQAINVVATRLNTCGIKALDLTLNSYESAEFFTFSSEHTYQGELGNLVKLDYTQNREKSVQQHLIKKGKITILDQELLKLYGLKDKLELNEEVQISYYLNSESEDERIITEIVIYHD